MPNGSYGEAKGFYGGRGIYGSSDPLRRKEYVLLCLIMFDCAFVCLIVLDCVCLCLIVLDCACFCLFCFHVLFSAFCGSFVHFRACLCLFVLL
jgi:hypothetical protein